MKKQKYKKEYKELVDKFMHLVNYQVSRLCLNFVNDVWKLNRKYFDMKELCGEEQNG